MPDELPPAKKSYKLSELIDGKFYRCRLSGKVVRYCSGTIGYFNDVTGKYAVEHNYLFNFQLEDI